MRWRQRGRRSTRGMLGEREWSGGGARESRGWALEWLRVAAAKTEGRFELSAITLVGGQGSWLNREDLKGLGFKIKGTATAPGGRKGGGGEGHDSPLAGKYYCNPPCMRAQCHTSPHLSSVT